MRQEQIARLRGTGLAMLVVALGVLVGTDPGSAQSSAPRFGTWRLKVEKSTYSPGRPPKSLVRTDEPVGDAVRVTYDGIASRSSGSATGHGRPR